MIIVILLFFGGLLVFLRDFGVFTDFMTLGFRGKQVFRSFCSRVASVLVARVLAYKFISKNRLPIAFVSCRAINPEP